MSENLKCLAEIKLLGIKVCEPTITVPRLAIPRETHTVTYRNVGPEAPLVLSECLDGAGSQVSGNIKLVLGEGLKIAQQEICPQLVAVTDSRG
jgi:hypothetical protein